MATVDEIDRLYETSLAPRIAALENLRLDLRRHLVKAGLCIGVPFLMFFAGLALEGTIGTVVSGLGFALIFVGVLAAAFRYLIPGVTAFLNYQQRFKHEVVSEIFRLVCPAGTYEPNAGIATEEFDQFGLFSTNGSLKSDDRVSGRFGAIPFQAAEVRRWRTTRGRNSATFVYFHGLFFQATFTRRVGGTVIVQAASTPAYRLGSRDGLRPVPVDDESFAALFEVHASDEAAAADLLTPAFRERLRALHERTDAPVYFACRDHRAAIAIHYDRTLFEPGVARTTSKEAIQGMAREFDLVGTIVEELDHNARIWSGPAIVTTTPAPVATRERGLNQLHALAREGRLTPGQVWEAAAAATADAEAVDPSARLQPAGSTITIERAAGTTTVRYGDRFSFVAWIGVWILSLVVGATAFRATMTAFEDQVGPGPLLDLSRTVPAVPVIDEWVVRLPWAWLIASIIAAGVAALSWMLRVRRVEIAAGEIRIRRGLRPWPRRYARPPYNRVTSLGQAVYLKADGFSMMTPSASPMLSEPEAAWLASEMRRALKETGLGAASIILACIVGATGLAAQSASAVRNDLPQPYRTTRDWGELPKGVSWAAVTAIEPAPDGTIYVVHRCFENSCANRPEAPILKYDPRGRLLASFGQGLLIFPHGATVDGDGNLWLTDAGSAPGKGHQVLKFSPDGRVLMTIGKAGVSGSGPGLFDQPTDVVVTPGGDVFITDSHRNGLNNRVVHYTKDGAYVKEWGRKGTGRGEFSEPHTIALDSRGRLFVGDRENNRIQIFDQAGTFLEEWRQFGRPSGIAITSDDRLYVADSESWGTDTGARELPGIKKGIRIGSARTGVVEAFIEDTESTAADHAGAEGVGVDAAGNVYGGVVRRRMLERHVLKE